MKTLRYLLALLFVSALPLFSAFMPDAVAQSPSIMLGVAAKSDNEKVQEDVETLQTVLGPFKAALNEDVLKLVQELAKNYKTVADFTKNFDFKKLGAWGEKLKFFGNILDMVKYVALVGEVIDAYSAGDENRFIDAVDKLTREAAIDAAKKLGENAGEAIGMAVGTAVGGPIGTIIGKIGGGVVGEWLAEKLAEGAYDNVAQNATRSLTHGLYHLLKGNPDGANPYGSLDGLLPGANDSGGDGTTGSSSGGAKQSGQLRPVKIYKP